VLGSRDWETEAEMTSLTEWAAISDIVGNAAVVISLLVVAFTVAQNTTAIRAQIDNHWYDSQHASLGDIASNSELLALYVKIRNGQTLDELEQERYNLVAFRHLIHWEQAFSRHQNGFVEQAQWLSIDKSYSTETPDFVPEEWWRENNFHFRGDFIEHVDSVYGRSQR
jgi:hypothetical protein